MLTVAWRAALSTALLFACGAVFCQTGGSITLLSDYRYRGVSLSGERPTLRLDVAHDTSSGWYAGGSLSSASLDSRRRQAQLLGYLGHSVRLSERLGWDAGLTLVHFSAEPEFDYHEWFTGVQGDRWTLRLHYAPDYFGSGTRTVYAELGAALPLSRSTRAIAHLGVLARADTVQGEAERTHIDGSLGLAMTYDAWEFQLDVVTGGSSGIYPVSYGREHRHGVIVFNVSYPY